MTLTAHTGSHTIERSIGQRMHSIGEHDVELRKIDAGLQTLRKQRASIGNG